MKRVYSINILIFILSCSLLSQSCTFSKQTYNIPSLPQTGGVVSTEFSDCSSQVKILTEARSSFKNKKYIKALNKASEVIKKPCSTEHYIQALEIIGDIFLQRNEIINGFRFYCEAIENSKSTSQKSRIVKKMVFITSQKKSDEFFSLLSEIRSVEIQGAVIYETGLRNFQEGKDALAMKLLNRFIENFKDHDQIPNAEAIVKIIQERYAFYPNRIGVLLPLSGFYKIAGERALQAINHAVNEVNKSNPNKSFHLFIKDTESDPHYVSQRVKELNQEKVACIIGPMITAKPAAIESNRLKIPMVTMTQQAGIPQIGDYIFRNFLTPHMQIESSLIYFIEHFGFTNFAILYPDEKYGQAFKNAFEEIIPYYKCNITDTVYYKPGQTDFSEQITRLIHGYKKLNEKGQFVEINSNEKILKNKRYRAKVNFDVLFIPDSPSMLAMIAPQLRYHDIDQIMLMGTNIWNSKKLLKMANGYIQQAVFPDGFYQEKDSEKVRAFVSSFQHVNGHKPEYIEAEAYDTALMIMNALLLPHVRSRRDLALALASINFKGGVTCPVSFNESGDAIKNLNLFTFKDDKIVLLNPCEN